MESKLTREGVLSGEITRRDFIKAIVAVVPVASLIYCAKKDESESTLEQEMVDSVMKALPTPDQNVMKDLEVVLSSDKSIYQTGETLDGHISVSVYNRGNQPLLLVGSLDKSAEQLRFPLCWFDIYGPRGKLPREGYFVCGYINDIRKEDFKLVKPGEGFDPYARVDECGFFPDMILRSSPLEQPGTYTIFWNYSTNSRDIKSWEGISLMGGHMITDET